MKNNKVLLSRLSYLSAFSMFALVVGCGGDGGSSGSDQPNPNPNPNPNPGVSNSTTHVATLAELQNMECRAGSNVILDADITISGTWQPLCGASGFKGTFDGAGKTISFQQATVENVLLADGTFAVGLFGLVEGTIKNLTVAGDFTHQAANGHNTFMGAIAGASEGTIKDSKSTAHLTLNQTFTQLAFLGGIVGSLEDGTLEHVAATGNLKLDHSAFSGGYAGGIVGGLYDNATLDGCYNVGTVENNTNSPVIQGKVTLRGTGGIAGRLAGLVTLKNCYTKSGDVVGATDGDYTATIVGQVKGTTGANISNTVALSNSISGATLGTPIATSFGEMGSISMSNNYYESNYTSSGALRFTVGKPVDLTDTEDQRWWEATSNLNFDFTQVWKWDAQALRPVFIWE